MKSQATHSDEIRRIVRENYGKIAATFGSCCGNAVWPTNDSAVDQTTEGLGYTSSQIESLPEVARMGLGCGNPQAIAGLQPGETVLDLGSGAGFDCLLAAKAVGENGRVIGVDMTDGKDVENYVMSAFIQGIKPALGDPRVSFGWWVG